MSVQTIAIPAHYRGNVTKQLTMTGSSIALTALAVGDAVAFGACPDNIFVQALAANTGKIYLNIGTATSGGPGIELAAGANVNLPSKVIGDWRAIGTSGDKLNIIYQGGPV